MVGWLRIECYYCPIVATIVPAVWRRRLISERLGDEATGAHIINLSARVPIRWSPSSSANKYTTSQLGRARFGQKINRHRHSDVTLTMGHMKTHKSVTRKSDYPDLWNTTIHVLSTDGGTFASVCLFTSPSDRRSMHLFNDRLTNLMVLRP